MLSAFTARFRISREDALAVGGIWLLILFLLIPTLLRPFHVPGRWLVSPSGDIALFYAFETLIRRAYAMGQWPLWNPLFGAGTPLLGNPQTASVYPLTALFRLLPIPAAFNWSYFLHLGILASGVYALLRDLRTRPAAAMLGAIAFTLSGAVIPRVGIGEPVLVYGITWVGWSTWSYRRLLNRGSWKYVSTTAAFIALALLTGQLQLVAITLLIPSGYFAAYVITHRREVRTLLSATIHSVLVLILSVGLAAILLVPTFETLPYLWRSANNIPVDVAMAHSLNLVNIGHFAIPFLWYNISSNTTLGFGIYHEVSAYVGLLTLLMVPAAIRLKEGDQRQMVLYLIGLSLVGLALAWSNSPLYRLVHSLAPIFRVSGRFLMLPVFGLCLLGAFGLEAILSEKWQEKINWRPFAVGLGLIGAAALVWAVMGDTLVRMLQDRGVFYYLEEGTLEGAEMYNLVRLLILGALILGVIVLSKRVTTERWSWLVVGVLTLDMFAYALPIVRPFDARQIDSENHVLAQLDLTATDLRIPRSGRVPPVYGLPTVGENDAIRLAAYDDVRELNPSVGAEPGRGFALLSANYRIWEDSDHGEPEGELVYSQEGLDLYAESQNLPRLYTAAAVHLAADDQEALDYVAFEPIDTILSTPVVTTSGAGPDLPEVADTDGSSAEIEVVEYELRDVTVDVTTDTPVLLVLNDMHYPGWEASVDGEAVTLWKTNYTFRGVEIPAGTHRVEMHYDPDSFKRGLMATSITVTILIGGLVVNGLRARMAQKESIS